MVPSGCGIIRLFVLLAVVSIYLGYQIRDQQEIDQLYADILYGKDTKQRKYIIFELNKDEINDTDFFQRLVKDFFTSAGVNSEVFNIKDEYYIAFLHKMAEVKIQKIRDHFGKSFKKIYYFKRKEYLEQLERKKDL